MRITFAGRNNSNLPTDDGIWCDTRWSSIATFPYEPVLRIHSLRGALAVAMTGNGAPEPASAVFDCGATIPECCGRLCRGGTILGVDPWENQHGIG
jgi:hypothetical protein